MKSNLKKVRFRIPQRQPKGWDKSGQLYYVGNKAYGIKLVLIGIEKNRKVYEAKTVGVKLADKEDKN